MKLKDFISKDSCLLLNSTAKNEVLFELIETAGMLSGIKDTEELKKSILYREQLMSTGIGMGVGIPHVRFPGIDTPVIVLGVQPKTIRDYDSLDNQPVSIVLLILVGEDRHGEYIRLLSMIASRIKDKTLRDKMIKAGSAEQLCALFLEGTDE
ncbi:MAG: PTS sugar transporter subunit IIA [Spirochaetales bacterium]|nr:PTS sugar transporter subunit IIA [Spirochaetales bacterium]